MKYSFKSLFQITITLVFSLFSVISYGQVSFGSPEKINDQWKFILEDPAGAEKIDFIDEAWRELNLPHDWSVEGKLDKTLYSCTGYLPGGIAWYRKNLLIPSEKKNDKVYLYFEGVYNRSEVYLNGHLLGKRPNGYISFMYDATPYVEFGKENVIAVRVDHSRSADSRWYTGSGIYRDVYIVYANPVHVSQWGVFVYPEEAGDKKAVRAVEVTVENNGADNEELMVENELMTIEGRVVAKNKSRLNLNKADTGKINVKLEVKNPKLWSVNNPYLYMLSTKIFRGDEVIDQTINTTGIRWLTFDPDKGFALNGKWMKVKGVCLHHDGGVLGAAITKEVWERRLQTLKSLGCNAIRTSHNPQAPHLYELCDELGFLVMNEAFDEWEFPKRKWLEGWNVGTPGFQGSYDFFEEWSSRDIADMVRRDRNHISIFTWSIGNEVDYPNDPYSHPVLDGTEITQPMYGGYKPDAPDANRLGDIAKRLVAEVKKYDTSRPVTAALAGVVMSNETGYPGALDIAGYNYTEKQYPVDHEKYPNRVIYGSENRHDVESWWVVKDNEYIFGQFLWTGNDYLGESGRWPSRGFYSGLLDFGGFMKPRGYFRKSLWTKEPMAYLGTYSIEGRRRNQVSMDAWPIWNYGNGETVRVVCYTNTAKARLLLNGKEVGEIKEYNRDNGIIYWDVPFNYGKLEVEAINKEGKVVARDAIQSAGEANVLTAESNVKVIDPDKGLAMITVEVVDENGTRVMLSEDEVTCRIDGPAKLLGLEASNNQDMSDYTDNVHDVYHGRILAYVQATGSVGEVKIKFTAKGLKPAEIMLQIR